MKPLHLIAATALLSVQNATAQTTLALKPGDTICLVGSGIGAGLNRGGEWEALLHARFPQHQLKVRNFCDPGDEVVRRTRPSGYPTPTELLTAAEATVVIGFFGQAEAFAGGDELEAFKTALDTWVTTTLAAEYSGAGNGNPRVALVTPAAAATIPSGPDSKRLNTNIRLYADAMRGVAAKHSLPLVDLYAATGKSFAAGGRLTTNGITPSAAGYVRVAAALDAGLFGRGRGSAPPDAVTAAVLAKNALARHRYFPANSDSAFGPRAGTGFLPERSATSGAVAAREFEILDAQITAAEQKIWKAAGLKAELKPADAPPAPIAVQTNYGTGKNRGKEGSLTYLKPSLAKRRFRPAEGYAIDLFACELDFDELVNPTAFCFDAKGRMWIASSPSYPGFKPDPKGGAAPDDKILVLTDRDRDGRADTCKVFADGLHLPTGLALGDGGVYIAVAPDLLFLKDSSGDGKADSCEVLLSGFGTANAHHGIGSLTWSPDGWLHFAEGAFDESVVETAWGIVRNAGAGSYRYQPVTRKLEVFAAHNFINPRGLCFDGWGNAVLADASTGSMYFLNAVSVAPPPGAKLGPARPFAKSRSNPVSACEFVSSTHFPDALRGDLLLGTCIGMLGALRFDLELADSDTFFTATEAPPVVLSTDGNFRPVDLDFGPDGALYLCDWHNAMLGHFEHPLRDPNRDRSHGRIWRVAYPSRPVDSLPEIAGVSPGKLLPLLAHPQPAVRTLTKLELRQSPAAPVLKAALQWGASLDRGDPLYERNLVEILNLHAHFAQPNTSLLRNLLRAKAPEARAAAVRILTDWRKAEPGALAMLKVLAGDGDPRVRLEAVRAASFFEDKRALEVLETAAGEPMDTPLRYAYEQAMKTLRTHFPAPAAEPEPGA